MAAFTAVMVGPAKCRPQAVKSSDGKRRIGWRQVATVTLAAINEIEAQKLADLLNEMEGGELNVSITIAQQGL